MLELGESLRVFGVGEPGSPEKEALLGVDSEAEDLQRLENPFLATALEMAAMDWREEALGLFRKAREVSVSLLEERRALLGEADCLVRLNRPEEAMKIYRGMIRTSAAGITEELFTIVELLRKQGEWEAIYELMTEILDRVPLPRETERWAEEIQGNVEPLTRLTHRIPILPAKGYDPSYLCDHPMKARKDEATGGLTFHSDAARRACFGRLIQFGGGPLRLEATVEFHRLEWAAYFYLGLFRIQEKKTDALSSSGVWIFAESGRCTDVPAVMLKVPGAIGWTVQEFPPELPTVYSFDLVYAPSMDHLTLTIRDETRGKAWEGGRKYSTKLAPGKYCVALAGGSEHSTTTFQSRFTVRRFEIVTTAPGDGPIPWEPAEGAFILPRANAALCLDDAPAALDLIGKAKPGATGFHEHCAIPYWDRRETDPRSGAANLLVKAVAELRNGNRPGFETAFSAALEEDPAPVFWSMARGFPSLTPEERAAFGKVLRKNLTSDGGALAGRIADNFETGGNRRPADVSRTPEPFRAALANTLRGIATAPNTAFAEQALAGFLSMWTQFDPSLLEAAFRTTEFESRARWQRLLMESQNFQTAGDWRNAKKTLEILVGEAPEDPRALNALAWLLVTSRVEALKDPARARKLAEKAAALCEGPGSPYRPILAGCLDTLARAHFLLGNVEEAVRVQEQAVASLEPGDDRARGQLENALAEYRKALEGRKE